MPLLNALVSLVIATSQAGFSLARSGPPPADPGNCFAGKLPFFQNFARTQGDSFDRSSQLQNACNELVNDNWNVAQTAGERAGGVLGSVGGALFGQATGAFENLDANPAQRAFKAELERIKRIPNSMERIQKVYELVAKTQGFYDQDGNGLPTLTSGKFFWGTNAGNLIDNAKRRGTVGVCREMASLLNWSLLQVARWSGSKSAALGPNDFSSSIVMSTAAMSNGTWGAHAWVRINMPVHSSSGALTDFRHFDLDTTWYPERFSPLFPRRAGASSQNIATLKKQCAELTICLSRKGFYESSRRSSNPTSGSSQSPRPTRSNR